MSMALPGFWSRLLSTPLHELVRTGVSGSLDWRVTLAAANPPVLIAEAIRRVVTKTRLRRQEQCNVAEELLLHFQDGLDAGKTAEELVAAFGDTELAARLIRRAKVRCRTTGWRVWWCMTRGTALLGLAYLAYGMCLMVPRPVVSTRFLSTINEPIHSRPEAEKAWPDYARLLVELDEAAANPPGTPPIQVAGGLMEGLSEYAFAFSLGEPGRTADQQARLDDWLVSHAAWLAELRVAALKPSLGVGIGPSGDFPEGAKVLMGYTLPNDDDLWRGSLFSSLHPQQNLRVLADWLVADAEHARRHGDSERALENIISAIGLSRQAREPAVFLDTLIADRIVELAIRETAMTLTRSSELWSDGQLRDLAHAYTAIDRSTMHWLTGEEAGYRDFIDRLFAGERLSLEGLQTFGRDIDLPDELIAALQAARQEKRDLAEGFSNELGARLVYQVQAAAIMPWVTSGVTRSEAMRDASALVAIARRRTSSPVWCRRPSVDEAIERLPSLRAAIASTFHLTDSWIDNRLRLDGKIEGMFIGIALELYRRESGKWPESLNALAPRWVPELPVDPINGGPLGYRIVEGKPVVYSLGVDRDNDRGRLPAACNPEATRNEGYRWHRYRPGPPLDRPMTPDSRWWEDGDWVLWSLDEPRYMPELPRGTAN